jgi:hypothetical protein
MSHVGTFDGADNVVLSLTSVAPAKNITIKDRPQSGIKYEALDIAMINTSFSVLGSLGFGDFMSTKISSNVFCSYMDLVVSKHIDITSNPDSIIGGATFGLGFRLAILAYNIDMKYASSFASIAAAAKLKLGYTSYQVVAVGGGLSALSAAQPLISNLTGDFTIETVETIGAVQSQLTDLYVNKNTDMTPQLLSVDLDLTKMAQIYSGSTAKSYRQLLEGQSYALQRAWRGRTLEQALQDAKGQPHWSVVSGPVVEDMYTRILGLGRQQAPDDVTKRRVQIMLFGGT